MRPGEIRLTRNRLNAYLWAKQGLASKKNRPVLEVAEKNFGIYGSAPTCPLSLLARCPQFQLAELERETVTAKRLVRLRAMRASPYLVPTADLPMVYQATQGLAQADFGKTLRKMGISDEEYARLAERIEELLEGRARPASDLRSEIAGKSESLRQALSFVISQMCHQGRLVRGRVRGGWKSDRYEYALWRDWLPDVDLGAVRHDEARRQLAHRYFAAYGPARAADFEWWSGFTRGQTEAVIAGLGDELAPVDVLGLRGSYLALESERAALESRTGGVPRGLALLPVWDPYLMAYATRERYLDKEWTDRVVDRAGNATSAVLWNGRVIGVWDLDELETRLRLKLATVINLPHAGWKEARRYGMRIARMIGKKELILERCPPPRPLSELAGNSFQSPLKGISGTTL